MRAAATDLLNAFFPTDCLLCAGPMVTLGKARVCQACLDSVQPQSLHLPAGALCTRCGDALGMESARFAASLGVRECTACRLAPPAFERASAYATYDSTVRELLHLLKFGRQRAIAEQILGDWLAEAMLQLLEDVDAPLLVIPVPLHGERQRQRGFNQAEVLAVAALSCLRRSQPALTIQLAGDVLQRVRGTRSLAALAPHQRRRGLRGAFQVADPEGVRGRTIILVDDIMTTGATARECARVLQRSGAARVLVATVARAQPESFRSLEIGQAGVDTWNVAGVAHWDAPPAGTDVGHNNDNEPADRPAE